MSGNSKLKTVLLILFGIGMFISLMYSAIHYTGVLAFIALLGAFVFVVYYFKKDQRYICGYCGFIAKSERELHNHSLNCEDYKQEKNKESHNSLDIIKERYAKGEITKEEFDKMKEDLTDEN